MRNEILQLKDLGRMPNESINDTESIDELVNTYFEMKDDFNIFILCYYNVFVHAVIIYKLSQIGADSLHE